MVAAQILVFGEPPDRASPDARALDHLGSLERLQRLQASMLRDVQMLGQDCRRAWPELLELDGDLSEQASVTLRRYPGPLRRDGHRRTALAIRSQPQLDRLLSELAGLCAQALGLLIERLGLSKENVFVE